MNNPFRIHVTAAGNGYLAEAVNMVPMAVGGTSPSEAAELARSIACDVMRRFSGSPLPSTLMVRIDEKRTVAFVMRPFEKPFDLAAPDPETFYVDSDGNDGV